MKKTVLSFFLVLAFFVCLSAEGEAELGGVSVNIISRRSFNGRGKELDFLILKNELEKMGHQVRMYDIEDHEDIEAADINIFIAHSKFQYFSKARLNWFVPNAEVCTTDKHVIAKYDLILCKTFESVRIFRPLARNVKYIGFTSIDRSQDGFIRDYSRCLHIVGGSGMKGFQQVAQAWSLGRKMPEVTILKHSVTDFNRYPLSKQVIYIGEWIPLNELIQMQNECGIHLCPSKTEGFGHSIMEGMSVGAVVITTDGPPMNEFIKDKRCLVKYAARRPHRLATVYEADSRDLAEKVLRIQKLSKKELDKIGQRNREEFLRRDLDFKRRLKELMNQTLGELNQ